MGICKGHRVERRAGRIASWFLKTEKALPRDVDSQKRIFKEMVSGEIIVSSDARAEI